jgi:hypothetical protein
VLTSEFQADFGDCQQGLKVLLAGKILGQEEREPHRDLLSARGCGHVDCANQVNTLVGQPGHGSVVIGEPCGLIFFSRRL